MAYVSPNLARDYIFSVSTNGVAYTTVSGIQNLQITTSKDTADATTYDTQGVTVKIPVSFEGEIAIEMVESFDTSQTIYVLDTGQKMLLAADSNLGVQSRVYWKLVYRDATHYPGDLTGTGFVYMDNDGGGGNNDLDMLKGKIAMDTRPVGTQTFDNRMGSQ